jgi:DNA-binding CsgD family transcriptional regulator
MFLQLSSTSESDSLFDSESLVIYAYVAFFLSIIVSGSIAYITFSRKASRHRIYLSNQRRIIAELRFELEAALLKEEKSRKDVSRKTRDLTMLILYLILKNQALSSIHRELVKIVKQPEQNIPTNLSKILTKVALSMAAEKNWELFNANLQKLNFNFLDRLAARYVTLTPGDLKLCSLIKSKIHPKEIADLMEISRDSAKIAKHRLKRKLGLGTEANLDDFLESFDMDAPDSGSTFQFDSISSRSNFDLFAKPIFFGTLISSLLFVTPH